MNRSESKYFNTARRMDEALIALLEVKEFEFITVGEICRKAGVNRSTFYLHYDTIADLMSETARYINSEFLSYFPEEIEEFKAQIWKKELRDLVLITPRFLSPYLRFVQERRQIFRAAFKNPKGMQTDTSFSDLKKHVLEPILERFGVPDDERRYWIDFFIHGTMAIIRDWVMDDCAEPREKIEAVITRCVRPPYGSFDGDSEGKP